MLSISYFQTRLVEERNATKNRLKRRRKKLGTLMVRLHSMINRGHKSHIRNTLRTHLQKSLAQLQEELDILTLSVPAADEPPSPTNNSRKTMSGFEQKIIQAQKANDELVEQVSLVTLHIINLPGLRSAKHMTNLIKSDFYTTKYLYITHLWSERW
eukprot:Blabericola_migrator_1__7609@NODE_388_length_9090_cov_142_959769_g311_i0_p4_GENE_NODE_388_length_9090_cov_142_959769_g311_i0NODE_388_length_9090_cov_142_959769_g311_i0_p4_ORF_typecomplete_len156_score14_90Packaging_FI/PF14000_6/0_0087Orthopox_A5L/PF06193_11/0_88Sds3/PF08598_11/1_2e02Sds3/PF08598_11/1_3Med7/PF05983_11/0_48GIT_CC/PF16559_5/6_5e03GIT_CC/PF16559_5/9_1GIT_CC/PF16559_5/27_NODE_388_length_9090_cov_142_959769_g311_i012491716